MTPSAMNQHISPFGRQQSRAAFRDRTHAFLVESEQRVIEHCRKLLASDGLAEAERARLLHLLQEAEGNVRRLTALEAA